MSEVKGTYTLFGKVVLSDKVLDDGAVCVKDGIISYVGERELLPCIEGETVETNGDFIAPGFVDIHCHAGGRVWAYEDPAGMAEYHFAHGTTSLLCTIYRDFTQNEILSHVKKIKDSMTSCPVIKGVHLEGPYINPKYGSCVLDECQTVDKKDYKELADTGVIRQWTFSPEVDGTDEFLRYISKCGIVPAIGHSCAAPCDVYKAERGGARIVTHLFDATGTTPEGESYDGTIDVSFDMAALLCNNLYYEIICDEKGVHVRGDLVRLAAKTVGAERIIAVTDACIGDESESDINVVDGELYGSKLTMDRAARNLFALGFSLPEVFMMTSTTPARVIGLEKTGELAVSKLADILILDRDLSVKRVFASYDLK